MFKISRTLYSCLLNKQKQFYQVSKIPNAFIKTTTCSNVKELKLDEKLSEKEWTLLYALPNIKIFTALTKIKINFSAIAFGVGIPVNLVLLQMGQIPLDLVQSFFLVSAINSIGLTLISLPLTGLVGVIRIKNNQSEIQVSSLDFWGRPKRIILDPEKVKIIEPSSGLDNWLSKYFSYFLLDNSEKPVKIFKAEAYVGDLNLFCTIFGHDVLPRKK